MVNIKVKKQKGINKVKQKVSQKASQKVIVNVGDLKPKRRRAPPRPKKPDEKPTQPAQQAMPRTFYQQPNVDNSNLVALLMKNLTGQQEVKVEKKPNELEKAKPKEEEAKPAIELKALPGQKAEERRQANFDLGGTSLLQDIAQPKSSLTDFKAKFKNKRDDDERRKASVSFSNQRFDEEAEQRALDFFRAIDRPAEQPLQSLSQWSLLSEVRADPEVKSLGARLEQQQFPPADLAWSGPDTSAEAVQRLIQRMKSPGEGPKASAYSATPATQTRPFNSALNFVDVDESTRFDALPPARLARPEERGESLTDALLSEAIKEADIESAFATGGGGEGGGTEGINQPEAVQAGAEAEGEAEPLPAILREEQAPSTTEQLFNPVREPSLAEIVEPKVKKAPSDKKQTLKQLAIDAGIPINGPYIDENGVQKKSGEIPNYVLARELRAKGAPAEQVPDGWLVKSKAGKPVNKG